jgi:polyhydroxybutyrate depolymerase
MNRVLLSLTLALTIAACGSGRRSDSPDPGAVPPRLVPGKYDIAVVHDGRSRNYLVHVPAAAATRGPLPVLLAFHGGGGNPAQFRRSAGIDRVADREGFIAVYPAGTGVGKFLLTWNAGTNCCGRALSLGIDDVGFTRAVVHDLARRIEIDSSRLYATGHSNGAGMTYRLATEASDLLAAIVPVAGASMGIRRSTARPVPLLHIHSLDDPRALYGGGTGPEFPGTDVRVEHNPVADELEFWRELNGCAVSAVVAEQRVDDRQRPVQRAERVVWSCRSNLALEHWRLHAVGHGWPGGSERISERVVGPGTTMISAAEEVWSFVSRFRRQERH